MKKKIIASVLSNCSMKFISSLVAILLISACTYRVDSQLDAPDANPGDFRCARPLLAGDSIAVEGQGQGLCTLRAAIMEANATASVDRIIIPPGTYMLTLPQASGGGQLTVDNSVLIRGSGKNTTTISQKVKDRVFAVTNGDVQINNLTIEGGNAPNGAGITVEAATVEMVDVVIRENIIDINAGNGGGGVWVTSDGDLTMNRADIHDNRASANGGGIWNQGTLWVHNSTIRNNTSARSGGIRNSGNMNLRNSTVSGNTVFTDHGVGGISQIGFAVLNNVTITDNTGDGNNSNSFQGGGIKTSSGGTTVMKNSIVAGNDGGNGPDDCVGSLTADSKFNLIGNSEGCIIPAFEFTYILDADPELNLLASNGGATLTHNLGFSSPARNSAYEFPPPAADACESHDQRGVPRPQGSGQCDMGAVEITGSNRFVTGFFLVNAATDSDIRPLLHGDVLNLNELPEISIRAVVNNPPGSVVFDLDGVVGTQVENIAPYSLGGDASGDYTPVLFTAGEITLRATPFSLQDGTGSAGGSLEIRFFVQPET